MPLSELRYLNTFRRFLSARSDVYCKVLNTFLARQQPPKATLRRRSQVRHTYNEHGTLR